MKQQFFFNPKNKSKSFDVYINKNPKNTIPIKYTTVNDVKNTIKKLEKLFKSDKYSHKRIFQVAMILKVRLNVILKRFPQAKFVKQRFNLSQKYFNFIKSRTLIKNHNNRKKLTFKM